MKCVSSIHGSSKEWPEATVTGTFRNPYNKDFQPKPTAYCSRCAETLQGVGMFAPEIFTPDEDADA